MSEHTDATIIRQLRETVERQAEELAELRRLVEPFGRGDYLYWVDVICSVLSLRDYAVKKGMAQCPTSDT